MKMAEQKKSTPVKTVVVESAKEMVKAAGGIAGILAIAKGYFFPDNSPDSSSAAGLQSDKKGKGMTDEALFDSALAEAAMALWTDADARNVKIAGFLTVLNAQKASVRKNAILRIGLTESLVKTTDDKSGKTHENTKNIRGIEILKSWLQMDRDTLILTLNAPVSEMDILKERVQNVNDFCGKINEGFRQKYGDLPQGETLEEKRRKNGTNPLSSLFSRRQ